MTPFRIGVMESVSGPGETYGTVAVQSKEMAVAEINAAGGINGRMLELVVEDSKCNAQDAITAYTKLTDVDGVKIILGTSCSGAMLGAAPLAEKDGVVMFSGLATNPDIAEAGDYIFRTSLSDATVGVDTGNVLWADGIRRLATISESTDYAEGVRRTTAEHFQSLGRRDRGLRSATPPTPPTSGPSWRSCSARTRTPCTLPPSRSSPGEPSSSRSASWATTVPFTLTSCRLGRRPLEIAGDSATGVKAITPDLDPANAKAQEVLANFKDRYDVRHAALVPGFGL